MIYKLLIDGRKPMIIDNGVLVYDESDPRCKLIVKGSQGHTFAFITFIDKSANMTKNYWGFFEHDDIRDCILRIMKNGGKWDGWTITA